MWTRLEVLSLINHQTHLSIVCVCVCVCEEGSGRKVRREVRGDKEKWMDETIQGDLVKKMKQLQQQQSDTSRHHTR